MNEEVKPGPEEILNGKKPTKLSGVEDQIDSAEPAATSVEPESAEGAASQGVSPSEDRVEQLEKQLQEAKDSASSFQDQLLRAMADLENFRRRAEKEKSDLRKYSLEGLMKDILPVLDSFDQAMGQLAEDDTTQQDHANMKSGLKLIQKQLTDFVTKNGLEPIESVGCTFDPNLHQAIRRVDCDEVEQDMVHEQYSKGYALNGRVIRAAVVSVKVKP